MICCFSLSGEYDANVCDPTDPICVPCPDRLPSCIGQSDGSHVFPGREWQSDYITCYKNRTVLPSKKCTKGYFHPVKETCLEDVDKGNPVLYYLFYKTCPEMIKWFAYKWNNYTKSTKNWLSIIQVLVNLYLSRVKLNKESFWCFWIRIKQTFCRVAKKCYDVGIYRYWHSVQDMINFTTFSVDALPYCQAHPKEIIPMKDNCAHYIDCTRVLGGGAEPVSECTYPDLFSTLSMTCQAFTTVQCDSRPEPQAPCKYSTGYVQLHERLKTWAKFSHCTHHESLIWSSNWTFFEAANEKH